MKYLILNKRRFEWAIWKIEFTDNDNDRFRYLYLGRTNIFFTSLAKNRYSREYAGGGKYFDLDNKNWKVIDEAPTMDILVNLFKDE